MTKISRRTLVRGLGVAALAGGLTGHQLLKRRQKDRRLDGRKRPNIILFLADDMRHDVMGCAGNADIQTPAIDKLAAEGVYFNNAFVTSSICSVSRASIYTGDYALKHGVHDFRGGISGRSRLFFRHLRNNDYYTGFVGKWGIGGHMPREDFDQWYGFPGQGDYTNPNSDMHLTDVQTQQALDFLEHIPPDRPFFLVVAYKAPHDPYITQPRFSGLYDKELPLDVSDNVKAIADLPPLLQQDAIQFLPPGQKKGVTEADYSPEAMRAKQDMRRKYYQLVTGMDESIGNILSMVDQKGLTASTSVIMTSDNGMMLGAHGLWDKWYMFEESIRIPLIIKPATETYPDIKPHRNNACALNIDIAPTIVQMAVQQTSTKCHGKDLMRAIQNPDNLIRKGFFYEYAGLMGHPSCVGYRTSKWKLVVYFVQGDKSRENKCLYDLENDPHELHNLADDPAYRETLKGLITTMKRERMALANS